MLEGHDELSMRAREGSVQDWDEDAQLAGEQQQQPGAAIFRMCDMSTHLTFGSTNP
jgi:hypothetical protein